jgi:hypothetical protein
MAAALVAAAVMAGCSAVPKDLNPPCFQGGEGGIMTHDQPVPHVVVKVEGAAGAPSDGPVAAAKKVWLDGLQQTAWGGRTDRQNSTMACLTLAMQARGDTVSYDHLMGVSGAAFRIQFNWCPSAACSLCGYNCMDAALAALGQPIEWIDTGKDSPTRDLARARTAILASISGGVPLLYSSEECSLVVGTSDAGLLLRQYSAEKNGYVTTRDWPLTVGLLGPRVAAPPARHEALVQSLRRAADLADAPAFGDYTCGRAAYDRWINELETGDERPVCLGERFGDLKGEKLFGVILGNAYTYSCLIDARLAAARYLRGIAVEFKPAASAHLMKAADIYDGLQLSLCQGREAVPFPWALKNGATWTRKMRVMQAGLLKEAAAMDDRAVAELRAALVADEGRAVAGK